MPRPHVAYAVSYGAAGCLPDSGPDGPYYCHTRAELAALIRDELQAHGFPASRFAEVGIRRLWRLICNAGSASSYHFSFAEAHGTYALHFEGLTRDEADAMGAAGDA